MHRLLFHSHHCEPGQTQECRLLYIEYGTDFQRRSMAARLGRDDRFTLCGPEAVAVVCEK